MKKDFYFQIKLQNYDYFIYFLTDAINHCPHTYRIHLFIQLECEMMDHSFWSKARVK